MKSLPGALLLSFALTVPAFAADPLPRDRAEHMPTAPYLLSGAPTFDMTIGQFREKYNATNPQLPLMEYRAIDNRDDKSNLTRAASKISETLYASTALEPGTGKIKTLQITWLPLPGPDQSASQTRAMEYMTAMLRFFVPGLSPEEGYKKLEKLLSDGKGSPYFAHNEGALRFVVADNGDKGLTFAIEPLKLTLASP
ncbi:MAG: YiiQ family protein [Enterobacterales bacterium endosymbiont of Blomia tropicalis]|uniref:YiiQ family protein n=1 Tax=Mixta mediterraneensis TaxID=2758443 RepID=UPI001876D542|nr:YiiQ family protein [Mixta mediterraneensis]MBE5253717.1 YiiQ family protein [Mixta mediterraneensis]MDL4913166.1 YiiQ family protein [Mixta mediterraneensis]